MGRYWTGYKEWEQARKYAIKKSMDKVLSNPNWAIKIQRNMNTVQFSGIIEYAFPAESFYSQKQNKQMSHQRFLITEQVEQGYRGTPQQVIVDVWSTSMAVWMGQNLGQLVQLTLVHRVSKDRQGFPKFNNITATHIAVNGVQVNFEQQTAPVQPQYPQQYQQGYQQPPQYQGQYYTPQQGYMQQPVAAPQQPTIPGVYKASEIPPIPRQAPATTPTPPPVSPEEEQESDLPF